LGLERPRPRPRRPIHERPLADAGRRRGGAGASIESAPGEIDRLVLIAGSAEDPGDKLKGRKLFIVARDDANAAGPRLPRIRAQYERSTQPKELVVLDGTAHAQFIFDTPQADRLMAEILRFLTAK
jgi:hypothetical protein